MASEDKVRIEDMENSLRSAAKEGKWPIVLTLYKDKTELRTAKMNTTGDTVLHMAVSSGKEHVVESMVKLVCGGEGSNEEEEKSADENGDERKLVLGAQNEKGNTPLHLAASMGNVEMCKKISMAEIATKRNNAGETPLFMAALGGHRKAFLWLHHQYIRYPGLSAEDLDHWVKRDNHDTILHCALEEEHIDVAIEIVHLYKDNLKQLIMCNKDGVSPLHILAVTPSVFESTDLPSWPFFVRFLHYCIWPLLRVKKKKQATTKEELEKQEQKPCFEAIWDALADYCDGRLDDSKRSIWAVWNIIVMLLCFLVVIPLIPLVIAEILFHGLRNKKEEYTWCLQIVEELLQQASDEDMSANSYKDDSEAGSKIVDTPLMIAAKNGVIEMVEKILQHFPLAIDTVNEEGKNIVLLAAEKRQTKVYQILRGNRKLDERLFNQVDNDGNTALHLAAKLGVNLNWQTTTMVEEYKWFQFVKSSVHPIWWEIYNSDGKTAEEIFRDSYKEHMASDRQWLNQTSQTCSVASTLIASMAFTNIAGENFDKKNNSSLMALSLSLTSTISFLAILAFRSQSLYFWRYVPFMLQIAILTMFGSIVALWISLMIHGKSLTTYAVLGSPIAILTIVSLPIFIGPTLMSIFSKVPPPNLNATSAIHYRRPQKKENVADLNQEN